MATGCTGATTVPPAATPADVLRRHLRHYAIKFRNWTEIARGSWNSTEGF